MNSIRQLHDSCGSGRRGCLALPSCSHRRGYTVVELMVTIAIVSVLAATVGMFFVKLLNIQEHEREEAYVRERLADVCGAYADALSIGSAFITGATSSNRMTIVKYRQETGGVSLETGTVTRVAYLKSAMNPTNNTVDLDIFGIELGTLDLKMSRKARGDASLIPLPADMLSCTISPLCKTKPPSVLNGDDVTCFSEMLPHVSTQDTLLQNAALGWLEVKAHYKVKNDEGEFVQKIVKTGRVVRLWNRE